MGRRGPAPKPTAQKELEGNPGHRPLGKETEPQPAKLDGQPPAPKHIKGFARLEWDRAVPELYELGLLTKIDMGAIEGLCLAYGIAMKALAEIEKYGVMVKSEYGRRPNPALKIHKENWTQYLRFCQEFGLTPSSRTRVRVDEAPPAKPGSTTQPKDQAKEFLFERKLRRA